MLRSKLGRSVIFIIPGNNPGDVLKGAEPMKKQGKELINKYWDRFEADVNNTMQQFEEGKIDYSIFTVIIDNYKSRFLGQMDALFDMNEITMIEWESYYDKASDFYTDNRRIVFNASFNPS